MSPQVSVRRHRQMDIRTQLHCAPAFAAQPMPNSLLLHLACPQYAPQHAQLPATNQPSAELLSVLPPRVAAILKAPEPAEDGSTATAAATTSAANGLLHQKCAAAAAGSRGSVEAAPTPRPAASPHGHPAKRVRRVAGLQPRPLRWPPDAAAVALLLRAACAPFDVGLEPALQHLAPAAQPPVLPAPAAAEEERPAAPAGIAAGSGTLGGSTNSHGMRVQQLPPPQPALLPVLAHPCSRPPTPQQAAVSARQQ
jgi:hypothetical protein